MDPRVKTTATGLKDKFYLEMRLASAISRGSEAVSQARSMQEQLAGLEKKQGSFAEQAKQISAKLSLLLDVDAVSGQPTLKTVNNDAINLYKESEKADDAPTAAQVNAEKQLGNDLMTVLKEWNGLKTKDLTDLNRNWLPRASRRYDWICLPEKKKPGKTRNDGVCTRRCTLKVTCSSERMQPVSLPHT